MIVPQFEMDLRLVLCCVLSVAAAPSEVPTYDTIVVGMGAAGASAAGGLARAGRRVLALEAQGRVGGRVYTVPFGDGVAEVGAECEAPAYDTIVVGMGAAGASAAGGLARAGRRVLALEAQGRVGGRVHTVPFGDGVVEVGAEWIHGVVGSRVYDAALSQGINPEAQEDEMDVYRSDGGEVDGALVNELVGYFTQIVDNASDIAGPLGAAITRRMKEYIAANHPDTLEDQDFVSELLEFLHQAANSHDASSDWNDVTTRGGYRELPGTQMGSWHRHGYRTFFDIQLNTYNGGPGLPTLTIALNSEVTKITHHPQQRVVVQCRNGSVYQADNVIVTVSLGVLKARHASLFYPPLPEAKRTAIEEMSFGVVDKIVLSFHQPWWPENTSVIAFIWRGEDRKRVREEDHWTTKICGASRTMGSNNTLTLWLSGEVAKQVEGLSEDVVTTKSVGLLQRFMGDSLNVTVPRPTGIIRSRWFSNPFTLGSYSFDGVRAPAGAREALAASLGALHFAGEATSPTHYSTVHGASETGFREAAAILAGTAHI